MLASKVSENAILYLVLVHVVNLISHEVQHISERSSESEPARVRFFKFALDSGVAFGALIARACYMFH